MKLRTYTALAAASALALTLAACGKKADQATPAPEAAAPAADAMTAAPAADSMTATPPADSTAATPPATGSMAATPPATGSMATTTPPATTAPPAK